MSTACDCTLCRADPHHPGKRFHDSFRRIAACMPQSDLAACLVQYAKISAMGDGDDRILQQIGHLDEARLVLARRAVQQDQDEIRRNLAGAAGEIPALATTGETRDWLTAVARAAANHSPDFRLREMQLSIRLNDREYRIFMPPDWMAYANLFEVLLRRNYAHDHRPVGTIFDIGAFIGLSSVYLHSCYPNAEIIAVEPGQANLRVLDKTLGQNRKQIRYRTIGKLVAAESGTATMASLADGPDTTSMLHSTVFDIAAASTESVEAVGFSELVGDTRHYGIKLDIEGAEFGLAPCRDVLTGAEWILGEFHFGPWSRPEDRWLPDLLRRDFILELQLPRLEMTPGGEYFCIAQDYRAVKPTETVRADMDTSLRSTEHA